MHDSGETRPLASRRQFLTTAGAIGASVAIGSRGASAQEDDETTTSSSTTTETEQETVLAQITETTTLVDYEVVDETGDALEWRIVIESDTPTQLVLSDVLGNLGSGGSVTRVEQDRKTVTSGRTEARFTTGSYDGSAAVGVAVPGGAVSIGHELETDEQRVTLPFGVTLGAGIFASGTVLAAKQKRDGYRDEPEDVDADDGGLL